MKVLFLKFFKRLSVWSRLEWLTFFVLLFQTFIIYKQMTPTEEQAAAAKFEQAGKARERLNTVFNIQNKFANIKKFMDSKFQGDIYCRRVCSNVPLSFLFPSLKNEDFVGVSESEVAKNTMRLSRDAPKGVAEIYATFFAFSLELNHILNENKESIEPNNSQLKTFLKSAKIECRLNSDDFNKFNDLIDAAEPWLKKHEYNQFENLEDLIQQSTWMFFSKNESGSIGKDNSFSLLTLEDFRNLIQRTAFNLSKMSDQVARKCNEHVIKYEKTLDLID